MSSELLKLRSVGWVAVLLGYAIDDIVPVIGIIDKLQKCSSPKDGPIVRPHWGVPGISFQGLGTRFAAAELEETAA